MVCLFVVMSPMVNIGLCIIHTSKFMAKNTFSALLLISCHLLALLNYTKKLIDAINNNENLYKTRFDIKNVFNFFFMFLLCFTDITVDTKFIYASNVIMSMRLPINHVFSNISHIFYVHMTKSHNNFTYNNAYLLKYYL